MVNAIKQIGPLGAVLGAVLLLVGGYYVMTTFVNPVKANYAYPKYYPYPQPGYFQYLNDPRSPSNLTRGVIQVPRISNALASRVYAATEAAVDTPQYTPRSPEKDLNHVWAGDEPPAPSTENIINYEPDHKRGSCNPERDSNHVFSNIGSY